MLVVFGGLAGTGKTTLAERIAAVVAREYEPWHEPRLVVDTAEPLTACLRQIEDYLPRVAGSA